MDGRVPRARVHHARKLHIDAVLRLAVHLLRDIAARDRLADEAELVARLELLRVHCGQRIGHLGERGDLAVAQAAVVRRIDDVGGPGLQRFDIRVPLLGGVRQQHLAHLRAGDAKIVVVGLHGAAADDRHLLGIVERVAVERRIGRRPVEHHLRPVGVHLLGDDQRQRGHRALAHLGAGGEDGHRAIGRDAHPGIDVARRGGLGFAHEPQPVPADGDGEAERSGTLQKLAAVHLRPPSPRAGWRR